MLGEQGKQSLLYRAKGDTPRLLWCRGPRSSAEDAALGEAMVASKREEMDREIDHLLITQSENLRRYWEVRINLQAKLRLLEHHTCICVVLRRMLFRTAYQPCLCHLSL